MARVFLLLLLLDQVSSQRYPLKKYYYINLRKTWHDARAYCRENYHDLAVFHSKEHTQFLSKPQPFASSYSWIGLSDDVTAWQTHMGNASNSWMWSATGKPSRTGYQNFSLDQPNYYDHTELCVSMGRNGEWFDYNCNIGIYFVCFTESNTGITYTFVSIAMPWAAARDYCRLHHTDLVVIEDADTNLQISSSTFGNSKWIGLYREAWVWEDGSSVTYNNWKAGKPINYLNDYCVREEEVMHQWIPTVCASLYPFICERVYTLMLIKVKVNIQSSANLTDPTLHPQILHKMLEALRAHGHQVSNVSWIVKPQIQE